MSQIKSRSITAVSSCVPLAMPVRFKLCYGIYLSGIGRFGVSSLPQSCIRRGILETSRLVFDELQPSHSDDLFSGLQDRGLYDFIDDQPPADLESLRHRYTRLAEKRSPDGGEIWLNWLPSGRDRPRSMVFQQTKSILN